MHASVRLCVCVRVCLHDAGCSLHGNITYCALAPVTDGRGRGHAVGKGYLFLFM